MRSIFQTFFARCARKIVSTLSLSVIAAAIAQPVHIRPTAEANGLVLGGGLVDAGSEVKLQAVPHIDWQFDHWEGVPETQAHDNPITLTATEGLAPIAVMTPAPGAGWFPGGSALAWTEDGAIATNVTATDAIDVAAGASYLILHSNRTLTEFPPNSWKPLANDIIAVESGYTFNLALRENGTVLAWGQNSAVTNVPPIVTNVYAIAAGESHALALKQDGTVIAWGANGQGQATPPPGLRDVVAIGAGSHGSYAVKNDGSLVVWGKFHIPNGYSNIPIRDYVTNLVAIDAGHMHYAGVRRDGSIVAFGSVFEAFVTPPPDLQDAELLTSGYGHVAALRTNGALATWGWVTTATLPDPPPQNVVQVDARINSTIAVQSTSFGLVRQERRTLFYEAGAPVRLAPRVNSALTFRWFKDGAPIPDATARELYISAATLNDAGAYQLAFSSGTNWIAAPPTDVKIVPQGYPRVLVNGAEVRDSVRATNQATITLTSSLESAQIFYTTDGSTPTFSSTPFTTPITLTNPALATIRAVAVSGDFSQTATNAPVTVRVLPTFTLSVVISGPGRVEVSPKQASYLQGDVVHVEAFPDAHATFVRWANELSGTGAVRTLIMDRNWKIEALFHDAPKYSATIVAPPGTVTANPSGAQYVGTEVTITAVAKSGFTFDGWSGDFTGTNSTFVWNVAGPATFKAVYTTPISLTALGGGEIELRPSLARYEYGSPVEVVPLPSPGYELVLWGMDGAGKPPGPWTLTVTNVEPKISALFQPEAKDWSLSNARLENDQFIVHVDGTIGRTGVIQKTEDFANWIDFESFSINDANGVDVALPLHENASTLFFRIKQNQ